MKQVQDAYIVAATRSPIGRSHKGSLRHTRPDELLAHVIRAALALLLLTGTALARDDGRYAQSPLRDWVRGLKDKNNVPCCDEADGEDVEGWSTDGGVYRVKIKGEWHVVPDAALLAVPNRLGFARAWIYYKDGKVQIRCFLPGAGG